MSAPRHARFLSRTVLVTTTPEAALKALNTIVSREGVAERYRLTRYFEPRTNMRRRINFERCKTLYNEDMKRKIDFLLRTNRKDPYPGCAC